MSVSIHAYCRGEQDPDQVFWECPKCKWVSGNNWSQCQDSCPLEMSPHYDPACAAAYDHPVPYRT